MDRYGVVMGEGTTDATRRLDRMDCREARRHLLDDQRGRLEPASHGDLRAHVGACAACGRAEAVERSLTELLERGLPRYPASLSLKRRLAAQWAAPTEPKRAWWPHSWRSVAAAFAVAAVVLVAIPLSYQRGRLPGTTSTAAMVSEAVTDHLRVLSSEHPLDIESGGIHQVRPWFAGRLDFAPEVLFAGDEDFPLRGGAIGYFFDHKAAVFVYSHRGHTVSLFVFRAEGFAWPTRGLRPLGRGRAYETTARGFTVLLWETGELGYALVSDVGRPELLGLGTKLLAGP
jgi:anti-sigma factor RsiW